MTKPYLAAQATLDIPVGEHVAYVRCAGSDVNGVVSNHVQFDIGDVCVAITPEVARALAVALQCTAARCEDANTGVIA